MKREDREKILEKENKTVEDYEALANHYAEVGGKLGTNDGGQRYAIVANAYATLALVAVNKEILT